MNSEFIYSRSRELAENLLQHEKEKDAELVARAYWLALGREPQPEEVRDMLDYMAGYPVAKGGSAARLERWQGFWRVFLTSNEFNYVN
jgi:hypothetical protein